ncbi:WD40-repeat-containing domain protein [Gorgonomyces haynaldii]|nr:WD40-repeat-containing domain protein [Gorgonomyces haynaldii]
MAELLKLLGDLKQMSTHLNVGSLKHYFNSFDPAQSKPLRESLNHFHMKELEASDFRSAYHQFCDWLYGWNVNDAADLLDSNASHGDYLKLQRVPREIVLGMEREKQECERLMKTFETLCSLSRRRLKKMYVDLDAELPRVGQGLDTFSYAAKEENATVTNYTQDPDRVWGQAQEQKPEEPVILKAVGAEDEEEEEKVVVEKTKEDQVFVDPVQKPRMSSASSTSSIAEADYNKDTSVLKPGEAPEPPAHRGSFSFLAPSTNDFKPPESGSEIKRAIQRDINHIFAELDSCTEYTLVTLTSLALITAFAELLNDKPAFARATALAHELSMDFVSNTLKTTWKLLNIEMQSDITFAQFRDTKKLGKILEKMMEMRAINGVAPKLRMRKIHFKFATAHDVFRIFDINVLPNFIPAHTEGAKCAQYSSFDSSLWLTAGYDCVLRISDIRAQNEHICLAQYVGHKSIITDAHFTKNDAQIVSCSYDRTVKVWNSQSALIERNLVGHTDAVLSCHISPDGRYIASGSMDNTVRFWDLATGECITVIKKHTRWVKLVRFSPDGRHLATAGMDRRVYIWDIKILVNSRSPTHSRCIDTFGDYVLDMAMMKPSLLLTTSRDSVVRLFDYMTGHELHSVNLSPSWACTITFSDNGEYFATGSFDNNLFIFRTRDFVKLREIRVFNLGIMCVRFPRDLSYIAVGTSEGFLQQITL